VARTAVSSANVAMVVVGEVGRSAVYMRYNNGPRTIAHIGILPICWKRCFIISLSSCMSLFCDRGWGFYGNVSVDSSILSPTLYNLNKNHTPQTHGVHIGLFADDTSLYATERKEGYDLRKLQHGLNSMATWFEHWNIEINEEKARAIRQSDFLLMLNGWGTPFVNSVREYLGVVFDKKITWRLHTQTIEAKAFRTFIRIYPIFKNERLSTNIMFTLHKALISSAMTYACPACEFATENHLLKLQ
jgi:hypothetical protein